MLPVCAPGVATSTRRLPVRRVHVGPVGSSEKKNGEHSETPHPEKTRRISCQGLREYDARFGTGQRNREPFSSEIEKENDR